MQARYEASRDASREAPRAVVPKKVPTVPSGQQQVQVRGLLSSGCEGEVLIIVKTVNNG